MEQGHAALGAKEWFNTNIGGCLGVTYNQMAPMALIDTVQPLERIIRQFTPVAAYVQYNGELNFNRDDSSAGRDRM